LRQKPAYFRRNEQQRFPANDGLHLPKPLSISQNFEPLVPLGVAADEFHSHGVAGDGTYQTMCELACMGKEQFSAGRHGAQREA
jgi:hypothetical protein